MTRTHRLPGAMVVAALAFLTAARAQNDGDPEVSLMRFTTQIDFGADIGQNYGTLFEVPTADGKYVVGAGFVGVYNTRFRADRYSVQLFIRPTDADRSFTREALPRPSQAAGVYMFDLDGKLLAKCDAPGEGMCVWDDDTRTWKPDGESQAGRVRIGEGMMTLNGDIEYNGKSILTQPERGSFKRFYYANGQCVFYHTYWADKTGYRAYETDDTGFTKLYACPWTPDSGEPVDLSRAVVKTLPLVGATPFSYGQLDGKVLTCSNLGGVYLFDGEEWNMLVEPLLGTSYQVYSVLNYYDRLLLAQYPSGELFECDGERVTRIEGWPPRAREAQTTTIYGGELLVGVWPWGELWRYNPDSEQWLSMGRMFTHPETTNETTHPYETQCKDLGLVINQWGQRVTSLVPRGEFLMLSTSAKWPCEWKPEYTFVGDDKWKEYGAVYRLRTPGHLSAPMRWKPGETTLEFSISGNALSITQDGETLASATLDGKMASDLAASPKLGPVTWGEGIFGDFGGKSLEGKVSSGAE